MIREAIKKQETMVFIDAANIELSAKDLKFKIDYKKLQKYLVSNYQIEYKELIESSDYYLDLKKNKGQISR